MKGCNIPQFSSLLARWFSVPFPIFDFAVLLEYYNHGRDRYGTMGGRVMSQFKPSDDAHRSKPISYIKDMSRVTSRFWYYTNLMGVLCQCTLFPHERIVEDDGQELLRI